MDTIIAASHTYINGTCAGACLHFDKTTKETKIKASDSYTEGWTKDLPQMWVELKFQLADKPKAGGAI